MKSKETLEEAAERLAIPSPKIFIEGAKWQQEQYKNKYSEEEVLELLTQRCKHFGTNVSPFNKLLLKQDLEWFQQNKKK
jgi:hypothetical protein